MPPKVDMLGKRFGRLVVIAEGGRINGKVRWCCVCDCGAKCVVTGTKLRNGHTSSCGCIQRERTIEASLDHGYARNGMLHPLYVSWEGMKQRCENPRHPEFVNYGGRGIHVCARWRESFAAFLADVGERPAPAMSLDRKNNDGNYEPGNVRWATALQQRHNRRDSRHTP